MFNINIYMKNGARLNIHGADEDFIKWMEKFIKKDWYVIDDYGAINTNEVSHILKTSEK